jgi:hypothetical protein
MNLFPFIAQIPLPFAHIFDAAKHFHTAHLTENRRRFSFFDAFASFGSSSKIVTNARRLFFK